MTTSQVPDTSTTLLRDVADSCHARWSVFYSRYQPMMLSYLQDRFPSIDADDIVQETFVALGEAARNSEVDERPMSNDTDRSGLGKFLARCGKSARLRVQEHDNSLTAVDASIFKSQRRNASRKGRADIVEIAISK